mmetsp:Transcript_61262/g.90951  ORF Transcript_61262/g.90951 Transcript_61262/m.90951 type:complete len:106 (-) Transcript_61262:351-668(-)
MEKNFLCGIFPTGIWYLPELTTLRIDDNNIGGQIPQENITPMRNFIISNNTFSGNIEGVGDLTTLKVLELQNNDFTGTIPARIANNAKISKIVWKYLVDEFYLER